MGRFEDGLRVATCLFEAAAWQRTIKVECGKCRHVNYFQPHGLWWKFHKKGWSDDFRDARKRLYCLACWKAMRRKVRPSVITICEEAPRLHLPMPDEREWKREVNRFRG